MKVKLSIFVPLVQGQKSAKKFYSYLATHGLADLLQLFVCKTLFQIELQNVFIPEEKFSYEVFISNKASISFEVLKCVLNFV